MKEKKQREQALTPKKNTKKKKKQKNHKNKLRDGHRQTKKDYQAPKKKLKKKIRIKNKKKKVRAKRIKIVLLELLFTILASTFILWGASFFTFTFTKVQGYGMIPNLAENEVVFVNRNAVKRRFKLVYIKKPDGKGNDIRRIIGLPGESVRYKDDQLYINGTMKTEKFIYEEIGEAKNTGHTYTEDFTLEEQFNLTRIPEKKYLVLGDNRPYSTDSRYYGLVDEKEIIGVVQMRVLPINFIEQF